MLYVIDGFNWVYRKMHSHMRPKLIEATGRIERGEVNITLEKAYRLARVMGCDIRDLLP